LQVVNVVLEKEGEEQFDRSREKGPSITHRQGQEYPTYNKRNED
jgi:hypothetical protein